MCFTVFGLFIFFLTVSGLVFHLFVSRVGTVIICLCDGFGLFIFGCGWRFQTVCNCLFDGLPDGFGLLIFGCLTISGCFMSDGFFVMLRLRYDWWRR